MPSRSAMLRFIALVPSLLLGSGLAQARAGLEPLPGSPFVFSCGSGSFQVPILSPDQAHLFVSSFGSSSIASFVVDSDGVPVMVGGCPYSSIGSGLGGMAMSPSGDRLYVAGQNVISVHAVGPGGELPLLGSVPTGVTPSLALNGIAYLATLGGDFLYVSDNGVPNTVSAYWIGPDGLPVFIGAFLTGANGSNTQANLLAAPRLASGGHRLFVMHTVGQGQPGNSMVSVLDVLPGGGLQLAPGSPLDLGNKAASVVVAPSGDTIYFGLGGGIQQAAVAADGSLSIVANVVVPGLNGKVNGLAIDPAGRWLAMAASAVGRVAVVDAATLAPIEGGLVYDDFIAWQGMPWNPAGLVFDAWGRLFVGHTGGYPVISVYRVVDAAPPVASCLGSPDAPVTLVADSGSCAMLVDASSGAVGSCTAGDSGLASCTLDGAASLALRPGQHALKLTASALDGQAASCTSYVEVVDTTPPTVAMAVTPALLWPPNHRLLPVGLVAEGRDVCDGPLPVSCEATSSEPDDDVGDGATGPDVFWEGPQLWLRAERVGGGAGRVYTVTCAARDASGNVGKGSGQVIVPQDQP